MENRLETAVPEKLWNASYILALTVSAFTAFSFYLNQSMLASYLQGDGIGLTAQLAGARIRCIRRDSAGRLWFGTYSVNGLVCYDPSAGTWKTYTTENGLAAGNR